MAHTLHIGIRERRSAALVESYFPHDMPEDWRMDYLASVTNALWLRDGDDDSEELLQAAADAPLPVFLAVEGGDALPEVVRAWHDDNPEHIVALVSGDVWRPDSGVSKASVGLIPASDQPAVLRGWIEAFAAQAPEGAAALFIDGDPPSTATLDRVQSLAEMMGLS